MAQFDEETREVKYLASQARKIIGHNNQTRLSRMIGAKDEPSAYLAAAKEFFRQEMMIGEEVRKIITSLKNSKSTGTDFIDTWTIKKIVDDILPAVTYIINLSLNQSQFPSIWKQAKVVPILKKDTLSLPRTTIQLLFFPSF